MRRERLIAVAVATIVLAVAGGANAQYTLTVSSTSGGAVYDPGEGDFTYAANAWIMLFAEPEKGYHFTEWSGSIWSTSNPLVWTMDTNHQVTANFALDTETVTLSSTAGGAVTEPGEGAFGYDYGTVVTVSAVAAEGYHFTEWSGSLSSSANPLEFTADADYDLTANFAPDVHVVTLSSTEGGAVVTPGEGAFDCDYDSVVTLEAAADEGYHFTGWSGSVASTDNPWGITVQGDCEIVANFAADAPANLRTLTVSSTCGGCVSVPGEGVLAYAPGTLVAVQALPGADCCFRGWSGTAVDAGSVSDPAALTTVVTLDEDCTLCANFVSTLAVIFVDDDAPADPGPGDATASDPSENGTTSHPFDTIQEAINIADEGASIIVRSGVYVETIDFRGKSVAVTGFDPNRPPMASYPVIDGAGAGPVVSFASGEGPDCSLTGFVITRGVGELAGGIFCSGSSPTIVNCLIVGNRSTDPNGGAVYCLEGAPVLVNCTINGNFAGEFGGGLCTTLSNTTVVGSIVWGNVPNEIAVLSGADPNIAYSDIAGGWSGPDNLDADPLFAFAGYWADAGDPSMAVKPDEPGASWVDGDYHLLSQRGRYVPGFALWTFDDVTSPCVDAGDPAADPSGEPAPNGGRVNVGAYGGTDQASMTPSPAGP